MCGIIGEILRDGHPASASRLEAVRRQSHRGPDATGIQVFPACCSFLGHSRLAILDLSSEANQPMKLQANWIVFNGEIYNYQELREELTREGVAFRTHSDTEVLLTAYARWGKACLTRLNGMFAFAVYNTEARTLFAARDRFGQKPFFYTHKKGQTAFASELGALLALLPAVPPPDLDAIDLLLSLQYIPAPRTAYQGVFSLKPGECLEAYPDGRLTVSRWYRPRFLPECRKLQYPEAKEALRDKVAAAVRRQMVSDVPVGVFLSGGLDSSIVAAMAAKVSPGIRTVTVGFDEPGYSEIALAEKLARRYGTDHSVRVLDRREAMRLLGPVMNRFGQPFGDSSALATYLLCREASPHMKVALAGDGGDELFCGYQRYRLDRLAGWAPKSLLAGVGAALAGLPPAQGVPIERNWRLGLKRLGQVAQVPETASILRWGSYFSRIDKQALWRQEPVGPDRAEQYLTDQYEEGADWGPDLAIRTQLTDLMSYAPGDYHVKTDITSMAFGLEVRAPFMDHDLAEFALSLPPAFHRTLFQGKRLLRDAFSPELPTETQAAPKQGFGIPLAEWFRSGWMEPLADRLESSGSFARRHFNVQYVNQLLNEHKSLKNDHSKKLFLLLILELWHELRYTQL